MTAGESESLTNPGLRRHSTLTLFLLNFKRVSEKPQIDYVYQEPILKNPDLLEEFRSQVYCCTRCASCLAVCPTYLATGEEALSARGRISLVEAVLDGRLGLTRGLAERLSKCLQCGVCAASCPSGIDVPGAVRAMRAKLALNGDHRMVHGAMRSLAGKKPGTRQRLLHSCTSVYRALPALPFTPWNQSGSVKRFPGTSPRPLDNLLPEDSRASEASRRVAFFPGCVTSLAYQQTALSTVRVLNRAGIDVILPRGLGCCGQPFRSMGLSDVADGLRQKSLGALLRSEPDAIVTVCASCALTLREGMDEPGETDAQDIPVLDIHELLADTGIVTQATGYNRALKLTWHDPCHLKYGLGIASEPRKIIAGLSGVQYAEAAESSCCGGAGVFSLTHYELTLKIGLSRAEELTATGARTILTGCPGCRMQLEDMLARLGSKAVVMHTVDLLDEVSQAASA